MVNNYNLQGSTEERKWNAVVTSKRVVVWCMSVQVLAVCYFLSMRRVHLKHISMGSFQYFQYCEWEDFPFQHLHFITHVCACVCVRVLRGGVDGEAEWQREKTITNRMSPRKWSLVNKGGMELIFQTGIQVPFGAGRSGGGERGKKTS